MESKIKHLLYVPFTGLGLYGGFRGNRWLKNRIQIFKQFVVPSLLAQTDKNFILWVSWRYEDRTNKMVDELKSYLESRFTVIFTYSGVCFWDDKYPDEIAHERLVTSVHNSMGELLNLIGECDTVLMTIQPSDDCYNSDMVSDVKLFFRQNPECRVFGYKKGYVMNYRTLELAEWNPTTTPPFYTIKFPKDIFIDPIKHIKYIGPYKSHEFVKDFLKSEYVDKRGFIVGTHGENISTIFNHPFTKCLEGGLGHKNILSSFGLSTVTPLKIRTSLRKAIMRRLPYGWQRKLRYLFGERFYARFYDFIRS